MKSIILVVLIPIICLICSYSLVLKASEPTRYKTEEVCEVPNGCPFVDGSGGNLSTEELVLWGMKNGLDSGIHINDLADVGDFVIDKFLERPSLMA